MIKTVFIDYSGTMVQEECDELRQAVRRICQNSSLHSPQEVVGLWWKLLRQQEAACFQDSYVTEDQIVDRLLDILRETIHLKENHQELHELIRRCWVYAPLYPDTREFFDQCPLSVYVITNNGLSYVEQSMDLNRLSPAGIISSDMAQAYKPHRELFEKGLEVCGCRAEEVIHIGDSYGSDVLGARAAGIRPLLVQRKAGQSYEDVTVAGTLLEALELLGNISF